MKIAVIGIGALGCLLGSYLNDVGNIILIGHWPEQVASIREGGLWLERPDGSRTHHTPKITDNPADAGQVDLALVVVKSRQTGSAAEIAEKIIKPEGLAITLQNGLNNCATLRRFLGNDRVTLGVTSEGATVLGVGEVRHAGHGPTYFGRDLILGEHQLARLPLVVDLFNRAGFSAHLVDNTDGLVWGKLAINAVINPLTALLRVPNGFLLEHQSLMEIMAHASREVAAVAEAQGISLPYSDVAGQAYLVAKATATNRSSMLQDVLRGAPTEVEAICGAVAQIGRQFGISTPLNVRLCQLVRQIEQGNPPLPDQGDVVGLVKLLTKEKVTN